AGRHLRQPGGGELLQLRRHRAPLRIGPTARGGRECRILSIRRARSAWGSARRCGRRGRGTRSQQGVPMSEPMNRRAFVAASAAASALAGEAIAAPVQDPRKDRLVRLDLLTSREVGEWLLKNDVLIV